MPDRDSHAYFLLSCFAEFYEQVAEIKLAIHEGRLPVLLRVGDQPAPDNAADIAVMLSGQLASVLHRQANRVAREYPTGAVKAYRIAAYAMAALADEIFLLEMDWVGREAWLDVLLEYKFFKSRTAGRQFFRITQSLLDLTVRNELHVDLAAVLLMVLQLGFKGEYRGASGEQTLHVLRGRLFSLLQQDGAADQIRKAFPQAYQNLSASTEPARLAPLTPWYIAGAVVLVLYLCVSTAAWWRLTQPFMAAIGKG